MNTTAFREGRPLAVLGTVLVAVGFYLPWVVVNPNHDGSVPDVFLWGMDTGLSSHPEAQLMGLVPALLVAAAALFDDGRDSGALFFVAAGLFYGVLPIYHAEAVVGSWEQFLAVGAASGVFVSASGAYATSVGGLLLMLAGAVRVFANSGAEKAQGGVGDGGDSGTTDGDG